MRYLAFLFLLSFVYSCAPSEAPEPEVYKEIKWLTMEEAQAKMKNNPKKLLVDVYTTWCGPCKMLDRVTFKDSLVVQEISKNFYPVKFNAETGDNISFNGKDFANPNFNPKRAPNRRNSQHSLAAHLGVRSYPTLMVLDETLNVNKRIIGFKQPQQLLPELYAFRPKK